MVRKLMSVLAVASLLMVNITVVSANVTGVGDYAQNAVGSFVDRGIISVDGDFQGASEATRGFFAMILAKTIGLDPVDSETPTFKDVPKTHESYGYIEALELKGKITGDTDSEGNRLYTFRPDDKLNRAEAATMAVSILDLTIYTPSKPTFKDVDEGAWYYKAMETARKYSVIRGFSDSDGKPTGDAGPAAKLIRQDAVILASNAENPTEVEDKSYRTEPAEVVSTPTNDTTIPANDTTTPANTNVTLNKDFHNADYTGPFPAPEGIVLNGTYGKDQHTTPSGSGTYKFAIQTNWERPVACLDETRIRKGSKGKTWEDGWSKGYNVGREEYDSIIVPSYDDTPVGSGAGNAYYDEAYELGYSVSRGGLSPWASDVECPGGDVDLSVYNADGWYKYSNFEDFPSLKYVYGPPISYAGLSYSSQSFLGSDSLSLSIDIPVYKADTNAGTKPTNLKRIDILDTDMDATEQAMSTEEIAQAIYDVNKHQLQDIAKTCVLGEPTIATKTYGSNEVVLLSYLQGCSENLNQIGYAFKKNKANNRILTLDFVNKNSNITAASGSGVDDSKVLNVDFVEQFLSAFKYE